MSIHEPWGNCPSSPLPNEHILILSFPGQGHITPLMQLSRQLVRKGFLVTFVISERRRARSPRFQTAGACLFPGECTMNIRIVAVPDGLPPEWPDRSFDEQYAGMLGMREPVENLLLDLKNESGLAITCIISDLFVTWSYDVATDLQIDWVAFFTTNASCCAVMSQARDLVRKGVIPFKVKSDVLNNHITTIPGVPPLHPTDFPPSMQTQDLSHYRFQFTLKLFEHVHEAKGLILNTFYELENRVIDVLRQEVPVYTVGPLLLSSDDEPIAMQPEVSFWQEEDQCLNWLDTQPQSSVVYVSFGSIFTISEPRIHELAHGLEASQQPFLWVIRPDSVHGSALNVLPKGFLQRTKDRGLIISWAPQLEVLAHRGVGAFLSHCGWNSTLENISIGGVPMLCWPDAADQKINCRLLVDKWKIGMEFTSKDDGTVGREEVERVVRAAIQGNKGREMRTRATELKNLARSVMKEGGSSAKALNSFVESRKQKFCRKCLQKQES